MIIGLSDNIGLAQCKKDIKSSYYLTLITSNTFARRMNCGKKCLLISMLERRRLILRTAVIRVIVTSL